MNEEQKFAVILSKNRLARQVKSLCKELGIAVRESIKFDFDVIEEATGTMNQPTAREILESSTDL